MSAKSMFKMGFLSMVAATGLFGASNGFAADGHTTSNFEGVTANPGVTTQVREATRDTRAASDDVKILETPSLRWQVMDSKGNVYLLTPVQTKEGKAFVEYVIPYTQPTAH
jgi:hypothetical protein